MKRLNKSFCLLFALVYVAGLAAQTTSTAGRDFTKTEKAYQVLAKYISLMNLNKDAAVSGETDRLAEFAVLFDKNATVYDEAGGLSADPCKPDTTVSYVPPSAYFSRLKAVFPNGCGIRVTKSSFDYSKWSSGVLSAIIEKVIKGENINMSGLESKDTVRIVFVFAEDDEAQCLISEVKYVGRSWRCTTCKPCPVPAKPLVEVLRKPAQLELQLDVNLGLPLSTAFISNPKPASYNYPNLIGSASGIKNFRTSRVGLGFSAAVEVNLMFGKKRNIGFGTGVYYAVTTYKITADSVNFAYKSENSGGVPFVRFLRIRNVNEKVSMQTVGVPLFIKATAEIGRKSYFFFNIGTVVTFVNKQVNNYNVEYDKEAIYQIRNGNNFVFDGGNIQQSSDWLLTRKDVFVRAEGNYELMTDYFNRNETYYNVEIDAEKSGKEQFAYKIGFGGILRAGLGVNVSKDVSFKFGASVSAIKFNGNNRTMSALSDDYHSLSYGVNSYVNLSYLFNVGVQFKLK